VTTTTKARARAGPRTGDFFTDGRRLMQVWRRGESGATLEDARSPVEAPDLIFVTWDEFEREWTRVVRRRGA
jgi:hypothetical protein